MSDALSPLAYGSPDQAPQMDMSNADAHGDEVVQLGNERGQQLQLNAQGPPIKSIHMKVNDDGTKTYKFEANEHAVNHIQEMVQIGQQAIDARNEQIKMIEHKRQMLEAHPAIAQIGRLASLAAGQYFAPGDRGAALVRAAGAFGSDTFGRTPEDLAGEAADLRGRNVGIATSIAGKLAEEQRAIAAEERAKNQDERETRLAAQFTIREQDRVEQQRVSDLTTRMGTVLTAARNGQYQPGAAREAALSYKAKPEEAEQFEQQAQVEAFGFRARKDQERKDKIFDTNLANQNAAIWHVWGTEAIEKARIATEGSPKINAAVTRLQSLSDDYSKGSEAKGHAIGALEDWYRTLNSAGVPGFAQAPNMVTPEKAYAKITDALSKLKFKDESGKEKTIVAAIQASSGDSMFGFKEIQAGRREIAKAISDYKAWDSKAGQLEAQHEAIRKNLPADVAQTIPSLRPGAYVPKVPAPSPAPPGPTPPGPNPAPPQQFPPGKDLGIAPPGVPVDTDRVVHGINVRIAKGPDGKPHIFTR